MRILANENIPWAAISMLRENGHDVVWIRTSAPGTSDLEVLAQAQSENRILITFDKDFGELAFSAHLPATNGVVLFRFNMSSPAQVAHLVLTALQSREDWFGHFSVVEEKRIRMTPLPG